MNIWLRKHAPLLTTAGVLVALFTSASLSFDGFCSPFVVADLVSENAFLGIAALGMTLVILSGGIDLSVGSVIGFTTILTATLITDRQLHPLIAWTIALTLGAGFGALLGGLIQVFKLPAFLVTLGGLFFARGMAFVVRQESVQIKHSVYDSMADVGLPIGGGAMLSFGAILFLTMYVVILVTTNLTCFGRNLYALGGSEESAVLMGLPVGRTKIGVYALSGFCSAMGGIAMSLYMASGNPTNATGMELDVIAVVVIGGTLLTGGAGSVTGTVLGLLTYSTIYQITYFANLPASLVTITIGGLLLVFVSLQHLLHRGQG